MQNSGAILHEIPYPGLHPKPLQSVGVYCFPSRHTDMTWADLIKPSIR